MDKKLPNFKHMTKEDGKIYGIYNKVKCINPYNCHFIAGYPDGKIIKGRDFINTGWDDIPNGLSELTYVLSTGQVIKIPRFKAYLPLIECSLGVEGSRIFHHINVKCLEDNSVVVWRIILKEDNRSKYKIGDVVLSREPLPKTMSKSWKYVD